MQQSFVTKTAWIPNVPQIDNGSGGLRTLTAFYLPAESGEVAGPPPMIDLPYYDVVTQSEANMGIRWRSDGNNPGVWHSCQMCGWEFPENQMGKFQGNWYCNTRGHLSIAVADARRKQK